MYAESLSMASPIRVNPPENLKEIRKYACVWACIRVCRCVHVKARDRQVAIFFLTFFIQARSH